MNTRIRPLALTMGICSMAIALALTTGCKTPQTDWNARVGTYTYDQSVLELGPPDKQARLDNGVIVAEWLTRRGYSQTHVGPAYYGGYYGPYYGPVFGPVVETTSPNLYLRLIFAPDHKLEAWKTFYK